MDRDGLSHLKRHHHHHHLLTIQGKNEDHGVSLREGWQDGSQEVILGEGELGTLGQKKMGEFLPKGHSRAET